MEILLALAIGMMVAAGVWLVLRRRTFPILLGLTLLSYAVNLLIFLGGRIDRVTPPITLPGSSSHADPLPQALVLTAIVIGFGMTAYLVALALRALGETGSDLADPPLPDSPVEDCSIDGEQRR